MQMSTNKVNFVTKITKSMDAGEKTLTLFTTRMHQMILQYQEIKKENLTLRGMLNEREAAIKKMEAKLHQAENDYNCLKMAKMVEISDGDIETAQKRLAKLIRDVDKCITLLSEK